MDQNVKIFFNPFQIGPNVLYLLTKEDIGNACVVFKGLEPIVIDSEIRIDQFGSIDNSIIEFIAASTKTSIMSPRTSRYILYRLKNDTREELEEAFMALYRKVKYEYDPSMMTLIIENFIYKSMKITCTNREFFSSADRLRDDELVCLKDRVEKIDGPKWLFNLCKTFIAEQDPKNSNWIWNRSEIRLLHFITSSRAERILMNPQISPGTFILYPNSSTNMIVCIWKSNRPNYLQLETHNAIITFLNNNNLKYGLIAAPIPKTDTMNCFDKNVLMEKGEINYIKCKIGKEINQLGSPYYTKIKIPSLQEQIEENLRKRTTVHPGFCKVYGPGILGGLTCQENTFTIQTVNCLNEDMKTGGCIFEIGLVGTMGRTSYIDNKDGTYTASYHTDRIGKYMISIRLMKQHDKMNPPYPLNHPGWEHHIKDSPFGVFVHIGPDAGEEMDWRESNEELDSLEEYKSLLKKQKRIYRTDLRMEATDCDDDIIKHNIHCTLSIWPKEDLISKKNELTQLITRKFGREYQLHPDEQLYDQPIGGIGTAFLLTPKIVCTSSCWADERQGFTLERIRFIFGFKEENEYTETLISNNCIYFGFKILYRSEGDGFALIELDRSVENSYNGKQQTNVASISHRAKEKKNIQNDTQVYVIGHPCGLPLKVANSSKSIVTRSNNTTFRARLDAYGGNIGSPVFNALNHKLEGMLLHGRPDFIQVKGTYRSLIIPNDSSNGIGLLCYDIANVYEILKKLPQYQHEKSLGNLKTFPGYQTSTCQVIIPFDS